MGVIGNGRIFGRAWMNLLGLYNWNVYSCMDGINPQQTTVNVVDTFRTSGETDNVYAELSAGFGGGSRSIASKSNTIRMSGKDDDSAETDLLDSIDKLFSRLDGGACSEGQAKAELREMLKDSTLEEIIQVEGYILDRLERREYTLLKADLASEGMVGFEADALLATAIEAATIETTPEDEAKFAQMFQPQRSSFRQLIAKAVQLTMQETSDTEALRKVFYRFEEDAKNFPIIIDAESFLAAAEVMREATILRDRLHDDYDRVYPKIAERFNNKAYTQEREAIKLIMASGNLSQRSMESLQKNLNLLNAVLSDE